MTPTPMYLPQIDISLTNSNVPISDETNFSIVGDVELTRGNHVWSIPEWSQEFRIEFDILVKMEIPVNDVNVFRITNTDHNIFGLGDRIPVLFVFHSKKFGFRFRVNGNENYGYNYDYELNKQYQIEISQKKNSDGKAVYKIIINGETFHEVINTTPRNFDNAMLYLSDVHYDTFAPYGSLANLRISSVIMK